MSRAKNHARCDFCLRTPVVWVYDVGIEITMPTRHNLAVEFGRLWACCATCRSFLERKDVGGLVEFVVRTVSPGYPAEAVRTARIVWTKMYALIARLKDAGKPYTQAEAQAHVDANPPDNTPHPIKAADVKGVIVGLNADEKAWENKRQSELRDDIDKMKEKQWRMS